MGKRESKESRKLERKKQLQGKNLRKNTIGPNSKK